MLYYNATILTHALAWTLLHSLWQGAIIFTLLFVLLKALGNVSASVKYYLSLASFVAVFVWFCNTLIGQFSSFSGAAQQVSQQLSEAVSAAHFDVSSLPNAVHQQSTWQSFKTMLEHNSTIIMALYCLGLCVMLVRFWVNFRQLKTLGTIGGVRADDYLNDILQAGISKLNIRQTVQLFISEHVNVPMMLGTIKPMILLPVATVANLSMEQVEAIILHELAHIKRRDYFVNMLQIVGETVLFFNPFIWLISSIIRREREHCCDDMVVAVTDAPLSYATALAMLETCRIDTSFTLAATGNRHTLLNRIKRIMEMKKQNISYSQVGITILAIIAIGFSVVAFTPSFAQKVKQSTAKKSSTTASTVTVDSNGNKTVVTEIIDANDDKNGSSKNTKKQTVNVSVSVSDDDVAEFKKVIKEIVFASKDAATALSKVDHSKIDAAIAKATAEIDKVDWEGIKEEISKGLAELDKELNDPKLKKEIKLEIRKALEDGKRELEVAKKEMSKKKIAIAIAKDGDDESVANTNDFEGMLANMENDGLLDRDKKFSVSKKNGELYINGKKQDDDVYEKYRSNLNGKSINIDGKKGSLNISIDN